MFLCLCVDLLWLRWFCLAVGMVICGLGDFLVFWVGRGLNCLIDFWVCVA